MNPENPNFETPEENSIETPKPTQETENIIAVQETQEESPKTFEIMFEYSRKKESETLSEIPAKYSNCYKLATNFAGFEIKLEKK